MMEDSLAISTDLALKLIVGFGVGCLIGLEREKVRGERSSWMPGVRGYGLLSLLGTISAYISLAFDTFIPLAFSATVAALLVASFTVYRFFRERSPGIVTSIALAISFVVGTLVGYGLILLAVAASLFATFTLSLKYEFSRVLRGVTYKELVSSIELGIFVLLLYPLIPDVPEPVLGLINLRYVYYVFVLLLFIMFINYVAVRLYGERGLLLSSIFGSLVNSEATVTSLTHYYVETGRRVTTQVAACVMVANAMMVLRNMVIVLFFAYGLIKPLLIPVAVIVLASLIQLLRAPKRKQAEPVPPWKRAYISLEAPFRFKPAVQFAASFVAVMMITLYLIQLYEWQGLMLAGLLGGLLSSGAIVFTTCSLWSLGAAPTVEAVKAVMIALLASIGSKPFFVLISRGGKSLIIKVVAGTLILIGLGLLATLITVSFQI